MCFLRVPERGRIHTHPEPPVIDTNDKWAHESDNSESKCWIHLFIPDTVSSCRPDHLETWGISVLLIHPRHFHLHKTTRYDKTKKNVTWQNFFFFFNTWKGFYIYNKAYIFIFSHIFIHINVHILMCMCLCIAFIAFLCFPWPCERFRNTYIIIC